MWIDRYSMDSTIFQSTTSVGSPSFHVIHKIPVGDTPYVKAKHVQLVDKDPDRAIALFWAAINAGDRVDSALKDMAIVMKQQNRPEEAIEAIKSLRDRCTDQAQEALDNVLLDLFKRCGRLNDQIALLKQKLHLIHQGLAFNGKRTKTARSQGRKFQVSIEQEASRLLGNLGWAYMQQSNYVAAEAVYRKALSIEPDSNKICNLGICLMKRGMFHDARITLESVEAPGLHASPSLWKTYERAQEMLCELKEMKSVRKRNIASETSAEEDNKSWNPMFSPGRTSLAHHLPAILAATSGFSSDDGDLDGGEANEAYYDDGDGSTRRKRTHGEENEQQSRGSGSSSSALHQQEDPSFRLPLTSDWTNKTNYSRAAVCGITEHQNLKVSWKDDDDRRLPARRSLGATFDNADRDDVALLQNQLLRDNVHVTDLRMDRGSRGGQLLEEQDQLRWQRRLKVFEEMTLPAAALTL